MFAIDRSRFLVLVSCSMMFAQASLSAAEPLRVMSFNIRFGSAKDGDDVWEKRKELVAETIQRFKPDLLGTQETLRFQAEFLEEQLGDYAYFGRSRMKTPNEHCGIFYRTERFTWLAGGHFWLSETPEVPESKSWDSSLPRMASWVLLSDASNATSPPILMVNTHFDHRGATAREESARLLRHRIGKLASVANGIHVVVTGDFNAGEGSQPYQALLKDNMDLRDTFRIAKPERGQAEGTFNAFRGVDTGARIDWILASRTLDVQEAAIVRSSKDGRYPSDHFPVTAIVQP